MTDRIILNVGQNVENVLAYALAQIAIRYRLSDDDMIGLMIKQLAEWRKCAEEEGEASCPRPI